MEASPVDGKDRGVTARSSAHCRLDVVPYLIVLCESLPFKQSVAPSRHEWCKAIAKSHVGLTSHSYLSKIFSSQILNRLDNIPILRSSKSLMNVTVTRMSMVRDC
jgi:hypothetical protein